MTYYVGGRARLSLALTDVAGVAANGTVALTVTDPSGTATAGSVQTTGTGAYYADVDLPTAGRWTYLWASTGAVVVTEPGVLDVSSATPTGIVSLGDVRDRLNFNATTSDEEVSGYIDAATDYIESVIGPVIRRSRTKTVTPVGGKLFLGGPAVSLTTITSAYGYGGTYTAANYTLDTDRGVVHPQASAATLALPVVVTYTAGRATVPALIREAALDYIAWTWQSQRGPSGGPFQGGDEFAVQTPSDVPYKIVSKLAPYRLPMVA